MLSLHHRQPSPLIRDPDQTFKDQNKTKYSLFAFFLCQYCSSLLILGLAEKIFSFKKILTNMTTRYFHKGSLALAGRTSLSFPKRHICGVMKPLSPDTLFLLNFFSSHFLVTDRHEKCMRGYGKVDTNILWITDWTKKGLCQQTRPSGFPQRHRRLRQNESGWIWLGKVCWSRQSVESVREPLFFLSSV